MAEQKAGSRFGSWFRWTNPKSSPQQQAQPPQRPLSQRKPASQPQAPSSTQLQSKPPARSTSKPQPKAQTASQNPSQSQRDSHSQQTTQTASKSSSPESNAWSQPSERTPSQPPSPSPTVLPQPTAKTSSKPPSQSRTPQSQQAAQTAFQPPSPSQTASQPKPNSSSSQSCTGPQLQTATRAASQPQSSSRATTRSQTAARLGSRAATPTSTGLQLQPENQVTSHSSSPSHASSQSQPANMTVSKPVSPSQTETKTLSTTRTATEPKSPSHTVSQPQTPTQTSFQLPSPSQMASQSQPATKSTSQPPSRTASQTQAAAPMASQPVPRSRASIPSQQSRKRESQLSSSSAISPSKPKSTSSPSTVSPKPKAPSPKTAEPQPVLSQTLSKDTQAIAANSKLVLEPQNQIQRSEAWERTTETNSLEAYMESKPTEVATSMPIVARSSPTASETSTPQLEEFTVAPDSNSQSAKAEEKGGKITNEEKLKKETGAGLDETSEIQRIGQPTDKIDGKPLHMVSGSNTTTGTQSEATIQPSEDLTIPRTKHMEEEVPSGPDVATSSKGEIIKTKVPGNNKDRSKKSETHLKDSTSPGEQAALKQEIRDGVSRFTQQLEAGNPKHPRDGRLVSVVTFAGENRGASMNAGPDSDLYIRRGYKLEKEDDKVGSDGESNSKGKSICPSGPQAMITCINNNVQSINNSLLYDSSCSERNPGLHLELSLKPTKTIILREKMEPSEGKKDKFTITPARKLSSEPTVRRRCLRGLFMEPSESDPDNPQKPRRHGCRYTCPEKGNGRQEGN